jgi:hypothetical protein
MQSGVGYSAIMVRCRTSEAAGLQAMWWAQNKVDSLIVPEVVLHPTDSHDRTTNG